MNKSKFFSMPRTSYKKKKNYNIGVHGGGGLQLVKPAREPASSRPMVWASLKKSYESCPFAALCGPGRKKKNGSQTSRFPSETSRFAPLILVHRGSSLPWLVHDRSSLRLRRIGCMYVCVCMVTYHDVTRLPPYPFVHDHERDWHY